jgi:hypothetical protein
MLQHLSEKGISWQTKQGYATRLRIRSGNVTHDNGSILFHPGIYGGKLTVIAHDSGRPHFGRDQSQAWPEG